MKSVRVVLVGPMYSGNIGAVARVCANFDVNDLRIVQPTCDPRGSEAKLYAKGAAADVLEAMQVQGSLAAAIDDCQTVVGFTRRGGGHRRPTLELSELGGHVQKSGGKTALVFGREDGGLTTAELLGCTHVCSYQVGATMPSLNLSHAVVVAVSRLFEQLAAGDQSKKSAHPDLATSKELEALHEHWRDTMVDAGLTTGGNPERLLVHVRKVLARAQLSTQELKVFRAFLSKAQVALGKRSRGRRLD